MLSLRRTDTEITWHIIYFASLFRRDQMLSVSLKVTQMSDGSESGMSRTGKHEKTDR